MDELKGEPQPRPEVVLDLPLGEVQGEQGVFLQKFRAQGLGDLAVHLRLAGGLGAVGPVVRRGELFRSVDVQVLEKA